MMQIEAEQGFREVANESLTPNSTIADLVKLGERQLDANRQLELDLQRQIDEFAALEELEARARVETELEETREATGWLSRRVEEWRELSTSDPTATVTEVAEAMSDTAPVIQWGELGRPGPRRIDEITVEKAGEPFDDKFIPGRGGSIDVWQDPKTREIFLVNGARRLATAKRDGFQTIQTKFINAKSLEDAKLLDMATELDVELPPALSDLSGYIRESMPTPNDLFRGLIGRDLGFLELLQVIQGRLPRVLRERLEELQRRQQQQPVEEVEIEIEGTERTGDPALEGDSIEDQPQALEPEFEDDFTADVDAEDVAGDVEAPEPRPETEAEAPPEPSLPPVSYTHLTLPTIYSV